MQTAKLTPREAEVIQLIAFGNSQKEIADELHISAQTVDVHLKHIKSKTGLQKVTELTAAWFCNKYHISVFDLPETLRRRIAYALLALSMVTIFQSFDALRPVVRARTSTARAISRGARRTRDNNYEYLPLTA